MSSIILVSGVPAAGKSIFAIHTVLKFKKEGMNVFQIGIDGMKEDLIPPSPFDIQEWFKLPKNSVLVVDEAHKYFPVRSPGRPPEYIQKLTEIRHFGIILVLVTQDPRNIDSFIRRLVGTHYHLSRKMGFPVSTLWTFQGVSDDPNDYHARQAATSSLFKFPSDLYNVYQSSTLHLVKKKIPFKMILFIIVLIVLPIVLYRAYYYSRHFDSDKEKKGGDEITSSVPSKVNPWSSPKQFVHDNTPILKGVPWSKPIFQELKPQSQPRLYCVILGEASDPHSLCRCYTEQVTRVDVDQPFCHDVALHGLYNPYAPPPQPYQNQNVGEGNRGAREADSAAGEPPRSSSSSSASDPKLQVPPGNGSMVLSPGLRKS